MLATGLLLAASDIPASPVLAVMLFGVVMAVIGHSAKNPAVAAVGIALVFLATAAMFIGGVLAYDDDPGDPRPCNEALHNPACK